MLIQCAIPIFGYFRLFFFPFLKILTYIEQIQLIDKNEYILGIFMGIFYGFGQRKYAIADGFSNTVITGMGQLLISFIIIIGVI